MSGQRLGDQVARRGEFVAAAGDLGEPGTAGAGELAWRGEDPVGGLLAWFGRIGGSLSRPARWLMAHTA